MATGDNPFSDIDRGGTRIVKSVVVTELPYIVHVAAFMTAFTLIVFWVIIAIAIVVRLIGGVIDLAALLGQK